MDRRGPATFFHRRSTDTASAEIRTGLFEAVHPSAAVTYTLECGERIETHGMKRKPVISRELLPHEANPLRIESFFNSGEHFVRIEK